MDITHSYEGLGSAYRKARKGSPAFPKFMIEHAGISANNNDPITIVELGVGSGQQTEFVEAELRAAGISRYRILAFDKSFKQDSDTEPGQLDILATRIQNGELSGNVIPKAFDFDGVPLPIEDNTVDFTYMAHVIHHLSNKEKVLSEIARITRQGGTFFILGVTLEDMVNHPLDEFFPTKYGYEIGRYPSEPELEALFKATGFTFEPPFQVGSHNIRPIDREFLTSVENTTIDSALMIMREKAPSEFRQGADRVKKEVEQAEQSGNYRDYHSSDRLRVFRGIKR